MLTKKQILNAPPRPRVNNTTKKTDIFELENRQEKKIVRNSPTFKQSENNTHSTPIKRQSRTNASNMSTVFTTGQKEAAPQKKTVAQPTQIFSGPAAGKVPPIRKQSPFRPSDQPLDSFFMVDSQPVCKTARTKQQSCVNPSNVRNSYTGRDQNNPVMNVTSREKSFLDTSSQIFYKSSQYFNYDLTNRKTSQDKHENHSSASEWHSPHLGGPKTQVNERAKFDSTYARVKQLHEARSSALPTSTADTDVMVSPRINYDEINQPNAAIKRTNQAFSDMFNQEYGHKERLVKPKMRSISPHQNWAEFDSIRNAVDARAMQQVHGVLYKEGVKATDKVTGQASIFDSPRQRIKTDNIPSNPKPNMLGEKPLPRLKIDDQSTTIEDTERAKTDRRIINQRRDNQRPVKYDGIYKWKNNYKK